jgi:hypothetical protein
MVIAWPNLILSGAAACANTRPGNVPAPRTAALPFTKVRLFVLIGIVSSR